MAQNKNNEIKTRLDVIIGLLLGIHDLLSTKYGTKEPLMLRVARLRQLGLESSDIGLFFNKSGNEIAKLIYETKRKKVKK